MNKRKTIIKSDPPFFIFRELLIPSIIPSYVEKWGMKLCTSSISPLERSKWGKEGGGGGTQNLII